MLLEKRLLKLEQHAARRIRQEKTANCICSERLFAIFPQEFEKEMNRECLVHGFRRLGQILRVNFVDMGRNLTEDSKKMNELVDGYELRLSKFRESHDNLEDASETL